MAASQHDRRTKRYQSIELAEWHVRHQEVEGSVNLETPAQ
jgi:hypothetical protein